MTKIAAALLIALAGLLPAQTSGGLVRIAVAETGLHFVPFGEIAPHVDLAKLRADRLALFLDGRQVPIEVRGAQDGRLDPVDGIVFFGRAGRNPRSRRTSYVLGHDASPRRIRRTPVERPDDRRDQARTRVEVGEDLIFAPMATVRQDVIRSGREREHWYWKRLRAPTPGAPPGDDTVATLVLGFDAEPTAGFSAELALDLLGPVVDGVPQKLQVVVNRKSMGTFEWDEGLEKRLVVKVPSRLLARFNTVQLRNLSPAPHYAEPGNEVGRRRTNELLLDRAVITYETLLLGPGVESRQLLYRIPNDGDDRRPLLFKSLHKSGQLVYDVQRGAFAGGGVVRPGRGQETWVCCVAIRGLARVAEVAPLRRTDAHLPGPGADWVVVTNTELRPVLDLLVEHRASQGLVPLVVEARELYDTFTHGQFSPDAVTRFLRAAWGNWKRRPRHLLIVGDADRDVDWISTKETVPTNLVMTDYNGATASDAAFADVDGDGFPDLAVGRLPCRSRGRLLEVVQRIVTLEKRPEPGPWRRTVRFVAGEARFGPAVDELLARVMRKVVLGRIPEAFRVTMTWGNPQSPYFWPAPTFNDEVLRQLNQGSLVFTYVGHGSTDSFDTVRAGGARYPIMEARHVEYVDTGRRNPVLAIIACWTGEYDRPEKDAIGELLLRQPNGPVGVIASSRISHPYPDALLGRALAGAFFEGDRTLGEVLLEAKREMLEQARNGPLADLARPFLSKAVDPVRLVADHVHLYNLLGDPALRVPLPDRTVGLSAPESCAPGTTLPVEVALEGGAGAQVLLHLDRLPGDLPPGIGKPLDALDPRNAKEVRARHRAANQPTLARTSLVLEGTTGRTGLPVPADTPAGTYVLRAFAMLPGGAAGVAARRVTVSGDEQR